jgi:hypothetical protein
VYPQGGSGWLFSRAAAMHLLKIQNWWIRHVEGYEDLSFGTALARIGIRVKNTNSEAFVGHQPPIEFWVSVKTNPDQIADCKPMNQMMRGWCKQKYERVNRIIFLHSMIDENLSYSKLVFNAPNNLWYWNIYRKWTIAVCRSEGDPNLL